MTALYRRWERLAEHLDAALLIVHHGTKGSQADKRVVDVGAGASAQSRSADSHLALREHEIDGAVVLDTRVRSFAPPDPLVLVWEYPLWRRDTALDPTALKTNRRAKKPEEPPDSWTAERFATGFIRPEPRTEATIMLLCEEAGLPERKSKRLLASALDTGLAYRWTFKDRRMPHQFATIPQPETNTRGVRL